MASKSVVDLTTHHPICSRWFAYTSFTKIEDLYQDGPGRPPDCNELSRQTARHGDAPTSHINTLDGESGFPSAQSALASATVPMRKLHCPRCRMGLGRITDVVRHLREQCETVQLWICNHCEQVSFHRRHQFAKHHRTQHHCSNRFCEDIDHARVQKSPREALGCGFCDTCFIQDPTGYINHVANHYRADKVSISDWSLTTQITSLLMQPYVLKEWSFICSQRFGVESRRWPMMGWSDSIATGFIPILEARVSDSELHSMLYHLLSSALDDEAM